MSTHIQTDQVRPFRTTQTFIPKVSLEKMSDRGRIGNMFQTLEVGMHNVGKN